MNDHRSHVLACLALLHGLSSGVSVHAQSAGDAVRATPGDYSAVQAAVREGRLGDALRLLSEFRRAHPENRRYLYDFVAISSWNNEDATALLLGEPLLGHPDTPLYVIEAVARSARDSGQLALALKAYELAIGRAPDRSETKIGRANVLIDLGRVREARTALLALDAPVRWRDDVLTLLARTYESEADWIALLMSAEAALRVRPDSAAAQHMRFTALWRLGAPALALDLTPRARLTDGERIGAEHDRIAFDLRWARIDADLDPDRSAARWAPMDAVIDEARRTAEALDAAGFAEAARRQRYDLLVALVDRQRRVEAIALYESLAATGATPAYVRISVASAYLGQRRPKIAAALLEEALQEDRGNLNAKFTYFYALLESERYDEALAYIDRVAATTPEYRHTETPTLRSENLEYPRAQTLAGLGRAYTNYLRIAQRRLEDLRLRAPANEDIRNGVNTVYLLRGWPRRAERDYQWMLAADPDYAWAQHGLFDAALAVRDYPAADQALQAARRALPDQPETQRRQREWETHNLRELRIEATVGRSSGGAAVSEPTAARDRLVDAYLYSSPIDYHWRAFLHTHYSAADFATVSPSRYAAGAGAEYRTRDWRITGELLALAAGRAPSASVTVLHQFDDYWSVEAEGALNSLETPLRAYANNVDASRLALAVTYRWHESRRVSVGVSGMNFDDDNRRRSATAAWTERAVTGPIYTLDVRTDAYTSQNSRAAADVSYFNPRSDVSLSVTLDNRWQQIRRYERNFEHRVLLTAGDYWQEGFGSGPLYAVRYELTYAPDDRSIFGVGVGRTWRPYDGVRERLDALYLTLGWRF